MEVCLCGVCVCVSVSVKAIIHYMASSPCQLQHRSFTTIRCLDVLTEFMRVGVKIVAPVFSGKIN